MLTRAPIRQLNTAGVYPPTPAPWWGRQQCPLEVAVCYGIYADVHHSDDSFRRLLITQAGDESFMQHLLVVGQ